MYVYYYFSPFSPPSHPSHPLSHPPFLHLHRGGKWAATNLAHLQDFVVEEVLSDEVTPSPDGFTVFLGHFTWQGPEEKALIKLRPQQLPATDKAGTTTAATAAATTSKTPTSLRRLLSYMALQVHLESGAEYGYYHGSVSPLKLTLLRVPLAYHIEVIAPASTRQITRARVEERVLVRETPELYQQALGPLAEEIRKDGRSIQWVYNILDHKKEVDRIVFEDPPSSLPPSSPSSSPTSGFLLVPDPKWKSHPNPSDTPKEKWKHNPCTAGLACLAIVHDRDIGSLRDLRRKHVPLLKSVLEKGLKAIEEVYRVEREEVRVFVHYVPQFFHFHGKEGGRKGREEDKEGRTGAMTIISLP